MKKAKRTGTGKYEQLMETCYKLNPVTAAMVHSCEDSALTAATKAGRPGLIKPILVGPANKSKKLARRFKLDLESYVIVDVPHSHDVATKAVELVREGAVVILMKGSLHTDEFLGAIINGPLAFNNAIHKVTAKIKSIKSVVVNDIDILFAPDLEAGNFFANQLIFPDNADSVELVLGARVPVVPTNRTDSVRARPAHARHTEMDWTG